MNHSHEKKELCPLKEKIGSLCSLSSGPEFNEFYVLR